MTAPLTASQLLLFDVDNINSSYFRVKCFWFGLHALALLFGRQEEHLVYKKLSDEVPAWSWLSV